MFMDLMFSLSHSHCCLFPSEQVISFTPFFLWLSLQNVETHCWKIKLSIYFAWHICIKISFINYTETASSDSTYFGKLILVYIIFDFQRSEICIWTLWTWLYQYLYFSKLVCLLTLDVPILPCLTLCPLLILRTTIGQTRAVLMDGLACIHPSVCFAGKVDYNDLL